MDTTIIRSRLQKVLSTDALTPSFMYLQQLADHYGWDSPPMKGALTELARELWQDPCLAVMTEPYDSCLWSVFSLQITCWEESSLSNFNTEIAALVRAIELSPPANLSVNPPSVRD